MDAALIWLVVSGGCLVLLLAILLAELAEKRANPRQCRTCGDPIEPGQRFCEDCYNGMAW